MGALLELLKSSFADYLVFVNWGECATFHNAVYNYVFLPSNVVTLETFKASPTEFFYDATFDVFFMQQLKTRGIKTLLDVDGYFSKSMIFTKYGNEFTEIDDINAEPLPPIYENIYTHTYKNLAEVGFKHYAAVLIIERKPADFENLIQRLKNFSDNVIVLLRPDSELERHILSTRKNFAVVSGWRAGAIRCCFLKLRTPPEDFAMYVVTHKATPHDGKLPEGYKIIHAGKEGKDDLGYLGDDTGDHISFVNPYLCEITALYWIWRNTTHTVIGLSHYRRFFTESDDKKFSYDKILTKDAALRILESYDIIVHKLFIGIFIQSELVKNDCGEDFRIAGEKILREHLLRTHPDYLDAFEFVKNSRTFHPCNMFVTRRNVFEAYCKWLFSFFLDATEELLRTTEIDKATGNVRRLFAYLSERLFNVWLIRNRLRIRELEVMNVEGL